MLDVVSITKNMSKTSNILDSVFAYGILITTLEFHLQSRMLDPEVFFKMAFHFVSERRERLPVHHPPMTSATNMNRSRLWKSRSAAQRIRKDAISGMDPFSGLPDLITRPLVFLGKRDSLYHKKSYKKRLIIP